MSLTVSGAFSKFRREVVDLDPEQTRTARKSRDYLTDQLAALSQSPGFPSTAAGYVKFGSFARLTKIRPLNDIDLLIPLNARGTRAFRSLFAGRYVYDLRIDNPAAPLDPFASSSTVNSTLILNAIKSHLGRLPQYGKAEIHRNQSAVTFKLKSYPWVFDIVPAAPIADGGGTILYYLIPDGRGAWIRTDPRIDDANIDAVSSRHPGSKLRPTIRLLKYWNNRMHKPRLPSYYFETLALNVFRSAPPIQEFPDAIQTFYNLCPAYLTAACPDPKKLGPDLDAEVPWEAKRKIQQAMRDAAALVKQARQEERVQRPANAIQLWSRLFGSEFPAYG